MKDDREITAGAETIAPVDMLRPKRNRTLAFSTPSFASVRRQQSTPGTQQRGANRVIASKRLSGSAGKGASEAPEDGDDGGVAENDQCVDASHGRLV
jgi:hypothetical protein